MRFAKRYRSSDLSPRELGAAVIKTFDEHDFVLLATAIGFRVLTALVPGLLLATALLGFLELGEVYRDSIVPDLRSSTSDAVFRVIDSAVQKVLTEQQGFWLTIGLAVTVWQCSGIVRAVARGLNRLAGTREGRPAWVRIRDSLWLGAAAAALFAGALLVIELGDPLMRDLLGDSAVVAVFSWLLRWGGAVALLFAAIAVVIRGAPDRAPSDERVSLGALLAVGTWIAASGLFELYLQYLASYGSVFGNLATIFILLQYLLVSSIALLAGLTVDSILARDEGAKQS